MLTDASRSRRSLPYAAVLREYLTYLREHQCVAEATVATRSIYVVDFLKSLKADATVARLRKLSPKAVHDFILKTAKTSGRGKRKHLASSVRSFLRFAYFHGYVPRNLSPAVPIIAIRKLDRLPKAIPWNEVKKLLKQPDRRTASGRRDYAMMLLLATYGVRMGQVKSLRLSDVKWHRDRRQPIHWPIGRGINWLMTGLPWLLPRCFGPAVSSYSH